ncbi:MAG: hypothetical protein MI741_06455, partial [Rhodospirillales bacterium]|nr:hypothetical protein [Rhodospirillales bacterium]
MQVVIGILATPRRLVLAIILCLAATSACKHSQTGFDANDRGGNAATNEEILALAEKGDGVSL